MDNYGSRGGGGNKYPTINKNNRDQKYRRSHDEEMYSERDRNDDYYNKKGKKPEQNYYHGKQQQQQQQQQQNFQGSKSDSSKRYETRQSSEPRLMSNNSSNNNNNNYSSNQQDLDRNRPPKMPLPPSGQQQQRINNAAFRNLPMNIDSLPPRLKRKYLKEAGLPEELADKPIMELQQQASYSNSLPFGNQGGRGGYNQQNQQNRYDQYHQQQNFQSKYNNNQNHHNYHNDRPANHHRSRSITPTRPPLTHQQKHAGRNEWKSSGNNNNNNQQQVTVHQQQQQHHQPVEEFKSEKDNPSFDWSEDVLNSHSLPHDINSPSSRDERSHNKYDDNNQRQRNRRRRNRSASSNGSVERYNNPNSNTDNFQNVFKTPFPKPSAGNNNRQRRNSQSSYNSRDNSIERSYGGGFNNNSRENSLDRRYNRGRRYQNRRGSDNYHSSRENSSERYGNNWTPANNAQDEGLSWRRCEVEMSRGTDQKIAELTKQFENSVELNNKDERVLFDPSNPLKPIAVKQTQGRPREFLVPDFNDHQQYFSSAKPTWFEKSSEQYQNIKSKRFVDELDTLNDELMQLLNNPEIISQWTNILEVREKIQKIFEELLCVDMRFCQENHVEHYFWKILFYNIIEIQRKIIQNFGEDENAKSAYKERALEFIDTGTKYLESLLVHLETCHKFKIEKFIGENAASYRNGVGYVKLALVSAQKIFLFLGDLARYREQFNLTNNYGRAKNYYVKAQQIVPKNGKPFNQLALLAVYSKRKIDAVYFYMRSLMSSNPVLSAKESLGALFDEIRKKYEFTQRKRDEKNRLRLKEKEHRFDGNLRKETWIHPDGGSRVHRTGPLDCSMLSKSAESTDDEELDKLDPSELNKRFIISFLHVQGKLITKIGMDSFHTCATQMLKEFRALLHISPIPINSHRILQLLSLNMYAIDCNAVKSTETKDTSSSTSIGSNVQARSEVQECAITVALLMFGIIVERFIEVLKETLNGGSKSTAAPVVILSEESHKKIDNNVATKDESKKILNLNEDSKVILPAIKVWTDWMFYHENIWNPPPFSDFKIGATSNHDPWNGLASLMTLLETVVDANRDYLVLEKGEDCVLVRLSEDITLAGFTPLNKVTQDPIFCRNGINIENAQNSLRLQKLMFFGTDFLCKCKPQPILKKLAPGEYISIVQNRACSGSDSEILLESFSDEEEICSKKSNEDIGNESSDSEKKNHGNDNGGGEDKQIESHNEAAEIRRLLRRKDELERKQRMQERYNERLQDILSNSNVALHIEVRPRYLIPDTNTFIDDLQLITTIANAHPLYQLMIPIVVINELEGLSRGMVKPATSTVVIAPALSEKLENPSKPNKSGSRNDPQHAAMVTQACKSALAFLKSKHPAVKCVTTKGSIINATIFTSEDGPNEQKSNDDKILDTVLNLSKKNVEEKRGEVRFLKREVVLLTTDRNLRVKALTNDIPVRELRDFIRWSGLGS